MDHIHSKKVTTAGLLITLGIIFGDIGTSPLYTFQTILARRWKSSSGITGIGGHLLRFLDPDLTDNL